MSKVLLIDDDIELVGMFQEYLEQEGFEVKTAHDGEAGAAAALTGLYAIAILDVMMPRMNGLETLRRIRARSQLPILMLTGRGDDTDRIVGLELGADDYVPKPCNPRELLARVRAVLRRRRERGEGGDALGAACEFAGWRLDLVRHELRSPERVVVNLSSGEFALLRAFVEHPQRVLTRDQLLEFARGPQSDTFDRAIDVQISRLRRKLDEVRPANAGEDQELIRTVRNEGYLFTPKVSGLQ